MRRRSHMTASSSIEQGLLAHGLASEQDVDDARVVVVQDQAQVMDDRATIEAATATVGTGAGQPRALHDHIAG